MQPQSPSPTYLRSALSAAAALRGNAGDGGVSPPTALSASAVVLKREVES